MIKAATVENVIVDKLATVQLFKGGNTWLKDYDDLWRIAQFSNVVNPKILESLLASRRIKPELNKNWIGEDLNRMWSNY